MSALACVGVDWLVDVQMEDSLIWFILNIYIGGSQTPRDDLDNGKKCTGRSRISAQDKGIWGKSWYGGQDEKILNNVSSWSFP